MANIQHYPTLPHKEPQSTRQLYSKWEEQAIGLHHGIAHANTRIFNDKPMTEEVIQEHIIRDIMVQQFSLKAGLKCFGERGTAAITKELKQLHDMETYIPVDAKSLSMHQHAEALSSLIFLTEKCDGSIKAQQCADGSKQRH